MILFLFFSFYLDPNPLLKDDSNDVSAPVQTLKDDDPVVSPLADATATQPGRPLKVRKLQLGKTRMPSLIVVIKALDRIEKQLISVQTSALKEFDRVQPDFEKQLEIEKRAAEKRLNRVKDADKREDLRKKLSTEVEKVKASVTTMLTEQKGVIAKAIANGDFVKKVKDIIDDAAKKETEASEKLASVDQKVSSSIQTLYAPLYAVIEDIKRTA